MDLSVSIIGIGRLGGALALALARRGWKIENLAARNREKAAEIAAEIERASKTRPRLLAPDETGEIRSDLILIATQDSEIERAAANLAKNLAANLESRPLVMHTSGALSSEILEPLKIRNCPVGSIHPLVSISDARRGSERFGGAYFCLEGDPSAVAAGARIVEALGGNSFTVPTAYKTLYHAAAVTASGHFVAVVDTAVELLTKCGLDAQSAQNILLPLIKSTLDNLAAQTPAAALTGTFARADFETFARHLAALEQNASPEALEIYLQLGLRSTNLAEKQNGKRENLEKIRKEILLAKKKLR